LLQAKAGAVGDQVWLGEFFGSTHGSFPDIRPLPSAAFLERCKEGRDIEIVDPAAGIHVRARGAALERLKKRPDVQVVDALVVVVVAGARRARRSLDPGDEVRYSRYRIGPEAEQCPLRAVEIGRVAGVVTCCLTVGSGALIADLAVVVEVPDGHREAD